MLRQIHFKCTHPDYDRLRLIADEEEVSVSALLRQLIRMTAIKRISGPAVSEATGIEGIGKFGKDPFLRNSSSRRMP